jgi:chemotaxis response regulator CheB
MINSTMKQHPFIGVVCDASFSVLAGRIKGAGYRIARVSPAMLASGSRPAVDAWAVDCEDTDAVADAMSVIDSPVVALSNRPAVEDREAYRAWADRIIRSLDRLTADAWQTRGIQRSSNPGHFAMVQGIWLLAGSDGADIAVKEFFEAMPWLPPVAFLYAQHVDCRDQLALANRIDRSNRYLQCNVALGRHWFNPRQLLVVPADRRLRFGSQGEVFSHRERWEGRFDPHIDTLMMSMTGLKPAPTGAIMLSGASTDGLMGARALFARGTPIWAQDPATAAEPGMPKWIDKLRLASRVGSPAELARAFLAEYPQEQMTSA